MERDATGKFVSNWDAETKQRVSLSLTNTAWRSLDKIAQQQGISRSEVIERFARNWEAAPSLEANDAGVAGKTAPPLPTPTPTLELRPVGGTPLANRVSQITTPPEAALQQAQLVSAQAVEQRVSTILESITDAFVAFDREWRYTYVNHAATKILQKTAEELLGKHVWHEVFPELVGGLAYQTLHRVVVEQTPISWEEFGEPIQCWIEAKAYPSAAGVAVYFRDITERKQAEAERERLLQTLETERARFEAVLQQLPSGVMIADAAGKLVLTNDQAKQIAGYHYEPSLELEDYVPIVSFSAFRIGGEAYTADEYPLVRSLRRGEVITDEEIEIHRSDGSRIFVNSSSTPILDLQGEIVAAVAVFQDVTDRKVTEQALRESEARFRALFDANLIGLIMADCQGNIQDVNQPWLTALGYTREEVLSGQVNLLEITPPEYLHLDQQSARELRQKGRHAPFEKEYIRKDGTRIPVLIGTVYLGGPEGLRVGFMIDLTERKRLQSELEQQAQQFKLVVENAPDVITRINRDLCHLYASPSIELATGIPAEQFIGKTHLELGLPEESYRPWQTVLQTVFETGQEQTVEFKFPASGGIRWYQSSIFPEFNKDGSVRTVLNIARDVTDYKRAEKALRESEERLTLALKAAQMVSWDLDLQANWVVCSPNALEVWGLQEGTGDDFLAIVYPDDRALVKQVAERAMAGETVYSQEYRIIDAAGTVRWLKSQGRAYLDDQGRGVRMIGVSVDITERKAIETVQTKTRQQIEQLLGALQQKERQQQFLIDLNDMMRPIQDSKEIMWQVVCATGEHFNVTRCTYGEIDSSEEYVIVDRDYCNGVVSVVGRHHMSSFGPALIAELRQGKTIVVEDVDRDPRTAGAGAAAFDAIQTKSLLCVPLVKGERFVALMVLHHAVPRSWSEDDVVLMERIAQKTWLAVERSQAEADLRDSEARLQMALKVGRMGTWDWDIQTGALAWSAGHFTILGLQPYECPPSYELWASRVHPDDLAEAEAKMHQAIEARTEYYHEYRLRWSDGSIHWVEARGQFTYDAQGNPKHSNGAVINITERKSGEQERERLLERERIARTQAEAARHQLATIFDTSPVGLALLNAEQQFIAINEALAEINGLPREHQLGRSIADLFGHSDPQLVEVFNQIYDTGEPFISPSFAVNVPGRSDRRPGYYNLYYLPTVNPAGQVEGVLIYVVDVTERVWLESAQSFLAEASAVLASSLDYQTTLEQVAQLTVPQLADWCTVHIVDEDGSIDQIAVAHIDPAKLAWADQLKDKYPLNPDEPRGAAFTLRTGQPDLLPVIPDDLLMQAAQDAEHLEVLRQVGFKSVMTVPLRTQTRILGVISFIAAESGRQYSEAELQLAEELARRASLAIDNAQLYRVAQRDRAASEAARSAAEAANRIKDEFLAVLSHELRSPLNPILGWTKMLKDKQLDPARTQQALETIERNAKLQAQLIEDLLDVSRILQGKLALTVAAVNLAATIEAALETVRLAAEAKNIDIQTTFTPLSGIVSGDTNRLQQVFWNLLSNAVKFTPAGGAVAVRLEQVGMYAQIQVQDSGRGISPDFLPYVFDYFRQEDGTTTRHFGGLGLGLAIVRHITELHGGTVQADSPGTNQGSIFTIRLPLNVAALPQLAEDQPTASPAHLPGLRVLVVDDDADMRELAEFILTQAGAQVTLAESAAQALVMLGQAIPDLLLCDIGMPEMDGYALIRQIRQRPPQQGGTLPAIALTAYAGEINQQQAISAGFQLHVAKPVEPENLVAAIATLMAANRASLDWRSRP